jgi:hypothetical protein
MVATGAAPFPPTPPPPPPAPPPPPPTGPRFMIAAGDGGSFALNGVPLAPVRDSFVLTSADSAEGRLPASSKSTRALTLTLTFPSH